MSSSRGGWLFPLVVFCLLVFVYSAWMTGLSFTFSEVELSPNYNMLARAFAKGHLYIDEKPEDDASTFRGKRYLYFGPVPACLRLPAAFLGAGIPTGLMVVVFCAGIGAVYWLILRQLMDAAGARQESRLVWVFWLTLMFCGYTLLLCTLPYIHHEAIAAASFFFLLALSLFLRSVSRGYDLTVGEGILLGLSVALSMGSRFSYAFSGAFLILALLVGSWRNRADYSAAIWASGVALFGLGLLLAYNYGRFGSLGEFGMTHADSIIYEDYLKQGRFWRYDNIPYNMWDYFFAIPGIRTGFPFAKLTVYILKVESITEAKYFLLHVNELCASVFLIMPVLLFLFAGFRAVKAGGSGSTRVYCRCLTTLLALQVVPLCLSMASTARYCFDFLPVMMMLSCLGAFTLRMKPGDRFVLALAGAVISLVISSAVVLDGMVEYAGFLGYHAPLLRALR